MRGALPDGTPGALLDGTPDPQRSPRPARRAPADTPQSEANTASSVSYPAATPDSIGERSTASRISFEP